MKNIENRKLHFVRYLVSQNCLPEKNGSQKGITERDIGSQYSLPHVNLAIPYRTRIWPSNILTGHDFLSIFFVQTTISYLNL